MVSRGWSSLLVAKLPQAEITPRIKPAPTKTELVVVSAYDHCTNPSGLQPIWFETIHGFQVKNPVDGLRPSGDHQLQTALWNPILRTAIFLPHIFLPNGLVGPTKESRRKRAGRKMAGRKMVNTVSLQSLAANGSKRRTDYFVRLVCLCPKYSITVKSAERWND